MSVDNFVTPKKPKPKSGHHCAAWNCNKYKSDNPALSFFRFPKETERCKRWVINSRRRDLDGLPPSELRDKRICADHFEDRMFMNMHSRNSLVWDAIPTLIDAENAPQQLSSKRPAPKHRESPATKCRKLDQPVDANTAPQVISAANPEVPMLPSMPTPKQPPTYSELEYQLKEETKRANKYKQRWWRVVQKNKKSAEKRAQAAAARQVLKSSRKTKLKLSASKQKLLRLLDKHMMGPGGELIKHHVKMSTRSKQGHRFDDDTKAIALSLFHTSPKCYSLLRKLFGSLPSPSTLRATVRKLKIYPGFNPLVFTAMKEKAKSLSDHGKLCSIMLDEMTLKEFASYDPARDCVEGFEDLGMYGRTEYIANHAMVVMARGITEKWKQPLGYFLTSGTMKAKQMKDIIFEAINALFDAGYTPIVTVCDQGTNNISLFKTLLGVSVEKPYFYCGDHKILCMYDPPHLLKNVRNNLRKTGFTVDGQSVRWDHIKQFYYADAKEVGGLRYAPNLREKHVIMPPFSNLKVGLAAQIFSHSVSVGMLTMAARKEIDAEAEYTALLLEKMDKLFNCFNSYRLKSSKQMKHALTDDTRHLPFLVKTKQWLSKFEYEGRKLPCIEGWQLDINALSMLWKYLKEKGLKFLLTGRLNQDALENLFSVIRGKGRHDSDPDARQFRAFFRQVLVDGLLLKSNRSNCIEDRDTFLLGLKHITPVCTDLLAEEEGAQHVEIPASILSLTSVFKERAEDLSLKERDVCCYVSGYIARKVITKFPDCTDHLKSNQPPREYLALKQYEYITKEESGLVVPTSSLQEKVESLETTYQQEISNIIHKDCLCERMGTLFEKKIPDACTMCTKSVICLFMAVRLHHTLESSNQYYCATKGKKNKKLLKLQHK